MNRSGEAPVTAVGRFGVNALPQPNCDFFDTTLLKGRD
jgi:hypothetical protein